MARPLRSTGITRFMATTEQSAPARCFGTFGLAGPPLAPFPLAPPNRFSSSAPEPRPESRLLYPGHHMDGNQVSSMLFPGAAPAVQPYEAVPGGWSAHAVPEMKVGPSEPAFRSRLQTTVSCFGPMAEVVNVTEKA